MRIATSTVYSEQAQQIDSLYAVYQQQGQELSTGKQLNYPSDDPAVVAQDISTKNDRAVQGQVSQNLTNLTNQLTSVDGALNSLTNVVTSARSLAVEAANDTTDASQQAQIGTQVDQLLQEAIGIANTQFGGKYVFTGTEAAGSPPPVQGTGSPITSITAQANTVNQVEQLPNGQTVGTGVTLQQAFNLNAANGSPSVFQVLINLRDTLNNQQVVDESSSSLNVAGQYINYSAAAPPGTTLGQLVTGSVPQIIQTPLQADSTGQFTINIANGVNQNGVNVTLTAAQSVNAAVAAINAAANPLGITASFNPKTQRLSFTSTSVPPAPFEIQNVPSAGATNTSNFLQAFGLSQTADVATNVSTQLGDIDNSLQTLLNGRATVGAQIQTIQAVTTTSNTQVLNDTTVISNLEDADIAKVTSDFSQTQTVLQAAYATTSRLEAKTLFDYL
jgi:flagellar hook-associated protein 3 FlgL